MVRRQPPWTVLAPKIRRSLKPLSQSLFTSEVERCVACPTDATTWFPDCGKVIPPSCRHRRQQLQKMKAEIAAQNLRRHNPIIWSKHLQKLMLLVETKTLEEWDWWLFLLHFTSNLVTFSNQMIIGTAGRSETCQHSFIVPGCNAEGNKTILKEKEKVPKF